MFWPQFLRVFGRAPRHAFAPHAKARGFHVTPHQLNNMRFREAMLAFNHVKGREVIPRHGDNFRYLGFSHISEIGQMIGLSIALRKPTNFVAP